jgi:hypothetical protein
LTKKKKLVYHNSAIRKADNSREWARLRSAYDHEMKPILTALEDKRVAKDIKNCLKNYLVVSLVSSLEVHFRDVARKNIAKWKMDIAKVVEGEITIPLSAFEFISKGNLTKGSLVESNFNYADPDQINDFFSKMLNLNCFETIKELDRLDSSNYVYRAASLNRNWKSFIQMFELRNRLVHGKRAIRLSSKQLKSLCNCTMNFLDASQIVCNKEQNEGVQARLAFLRRKEAAKQSRRKNKHKLAESS